MESKKIRVGLVGYGFIGKRHCEKLALSPLANLTAIIDKDFNALKTAKEKYPQIVITDNLDEVIDQLDAVIVTSSTPSHFKIIEYLLNKNKHVFCEKPLCSNFSEVRKVQKILKVKKNLILQVGHVERYQTVWDHLDHWKKSFQGPLVVEMNRSAAFKDRSSDVDVVFDIMIHDLDLMSLIINKNPTQVIAFGNKVLTSHWDHVRALFFFEDASKAIITANRTYYEEKRMIEIFDLNKTHSIDLLNKSYMSTPAGKSSQDQARIQYKNDDLLTSEQNDFFNSIFKKTRPKAGFNEGFQSVFLAEKVLSSLNNQSILTPLNFD